MLQFQGRNITSEFDLLRVKIQAIDFIKPLKFEKQDLEKLADLVFELTKELIFNQVGAYIYLDRYKQEHKIGLEIYVYNKDMSVEKAQEVLDNNYNLSRRSIVLAKKSEFLDGFDLKKDPKTGIEVHILKWSGF